MAKRIDFSEREGRNRQLGERAEEFLLRMEKQGSLRKADLIWQQRLSKDCGDGLAFDIRSFDKTGDQVRFMEVKATNSGKYLPFFISEKQRAFSNDFSDAFRLYRVYEYTTAPRFLILPGAIEQHVQLLPQTYRARF